MLTMSRHPHAGYVDGQHAQHHTQCYAEEDEEEVGLVALGLLLGGQLALQIQAVAGGVFLIEGVLLLEVDAEQGLEQHDADDDAHHAEGICHCVALCEKGVGSSAQVGKGLLRSSQAGGVGDGAIEHTHHGGGVGAAHGSDGQCGATS